MSNAKNKLMDIAKNDVERTGNGASESALSSRAMQEVQAQIISAKRFPRDIDAAAKRIYKTCERVTLAEVAMYEYPRGNKKVLGASIRLAEAIAQNYGNLDFGIIELSQIPGVESEVMAYCHDLETNTRASKIFHVPHIRETKTGSYPLREPRDIYELVANMGARRLRSCLLSIIPGDITDTAMSICETTLVKAAGKLDTNETITKLVTTFEKFKVTREEIEKYLGYKLESLTPVGIVNLRKVYNSLNDGMADKNDYFKPAPNEKPDTLKEMAVKNTQKTDTEAPTDSEKPKPEPNPEPADKNPANSALYTKTVNKMNSAKTIQDLIACANDIQHGLSTGDISVPDGNKLVEMYHKIEKEKFS